MSLILRDIFGLEPKPASTSDDESSSECVVCMSAPRDTLVLPCRHLCLCKGCAEVLRFQVPLKCMMLVLVVCYARNCRFRRLLLDRRDRAGQQMPHLSR